MNVAYSVKAPSNSAGLLWKKRLLSGLSPHLVFNSKRFALISSLTRDVSPAARHFIYQMRHHDAPRASLYHVLHLSIYLSIYLFTYLSIYLPIYLSIYLSIHLSFYLSIYISTHMKDGDDLPGN